MLLPPASLKNKENECFKFEGACVDVCGQRLLGAYVSDFKNRHGRQPCFALAADRHACVWRYGVVLGGFLLYETRARQSSRFGPFVWRFPACHCV